MGLISRVSSRTYRNPKNSTMADRSQRLSKILLNNSAPMENRFASLFALKMIKDKTSYNTIISCMTETAVGTSSLLEHELAYVLGQMHGIKDQDIKTYKTLRSAEFFENSKSALESVLQDKTRNEVCRHECGEALAAMLSFDSLEIMEKMRDDENEIQCIRETCSLGCERLYWAEQVISNKTTGIAHNTNPMSSVDPAPPFLDGREKIEKLTESCKVLTDKSESIWNRYRAMFTLRNQLCSHNIKDDESGLELKSEIVNAFAEALHCKSSALFRHEIGYVLGQILAGECIGQDLTKVLANSLFKSVEVPDEHEMVRHESAMALGDLDTEESKNLLLNWSSFNECPMLADSCKVALSMVEDAEVWSQETFSV